MTALRGVAWMGGIAAVIVACGPANVQNPLVQPGGGGAQPRGRSASDYQQCKEMEQDGDATACWKRFKKHWGPLAAASERDYADAYIASHESPEARQRRDAAAAAARGNATEEGIDATPTNVTPPSGGTTPVAEPMPTQTVSYAECYRSFSPNDDAAASLTELTRVCGAPTGMVPVGEVHHASQGQSDQPDVYPVRLDDDHCFRFFVVGDTGIESVVAAVTNAAGEELAADPSGDRYPIVPTGRAWCPPSADTYKFVVSVLRGSGTYYFRLYKGPKTTDGAGAGNDTPGTVSAND